MVNTCIQSLDILPWKAKFRDTVLEGHVLGKNTIVLILDMAVFLVNLNRLTNDSPRIHRISPRSENTKVFSVS